MLTRKGGRSLFYPAVIFGCAILFLALTLLANRIADVPIALLTRDPAATMKAHPLTGFQSNLGILVWWSAASVSFFSYGVLHHRQGDRVTRSFLLWSSLITGALALDDFFLFHDYLGPQHLKLDQNLVQIGLAALVGWHLIRFRHHILRSPHGHLLLSLAFFGASFVIDFFQESWSSPFRIFFEDGFKLLGIVAWSLYLVQCCLEALTTSRDRIST